MDLKAMISKRKPLMPQDFNPPAKKKTEIISLHAFFRHTQDETNKQTTINI